MFLFVSSNGHSVLVNRFYRYSTRAASSRTIIMIVSKITNLNFSSTGDNFAQAFMHTLVVLIGDYRSGFCINPQTGKVSSWDSDLVFAE